MFEPSDTPRLFGLPCGVDFGAELVRGLDARLEGRPPEAAAKVEIIVNTQRMRRRLQRLFDQGPPRFVPRLRLITDLAPATSGHDDIQTPLGRKLELLTLVRQYLEVSPDLAPRSAVFDLTDSVAALVAEMREEGVALEALEKIDTSDQSGHWQRTKDFLRIVTDFVEIAQSDAPDSRNAVQNLLADWETNPPQNPILIAGSTGSRGPARLLMEAVARLPQGAVILPGVDMEMPAHGWASLREADPCEDHPQYRVLSIADALQIDPATIPEWSATGAPAPDRNALVSLALRPAPVTHAWLTEGAGLAHLDAATRGVTLLKAGSLREEALTIALRLREAAEQRVSAALITPDRTLTRLVTALLDQWGIRPDDSAGIPLHLTPPGRFLRHVVELGANRLTSEALLILLKHPLCHSGTGRNDHLRLTRDLELQIRREGPPFPTAQTITEFAAAKEADIWGKWLVQCLFADELPPDETPLEARVTGHRVRAEAFARGAMDADGTGLLWSGFDGAAARDAFTRLSEAATHGPPMTAADYAHLFSALIASEQQRERDAGRHDIRIWGTLEARVMDADLLILGGLNEGSWPEAPAADPWLNRAMRQQVTLLLPERRIGLSAHDFQQAVAGKTVWLTRSVRNDGAETVPSRWLNRLTNLLGGLPEGKPHLDAMERRGAHWIALARAFEAVAPAAPAPRPSPRPPAEARPRKLSVTEIKTLVRDPYAIYARRVLRLEPLEPLTKTPDPATRGTVLHEVMEVFMQGTELSAEALLRTSASVIAAEIPWPETRVLWQARMARIAQEFVEAERERQTEARPAHFEAYGKSTIPHLDFTLTAKADRIDLEPGGAMQVHDYKTGHVPTAKEQRVFDKQLMLMAAMAEAGAFAEVDAAPVSAARFLGLGPKLDVVPAPLNEVPVPQVWAEFETLITAMQSEDFGFTARRAMQLKDHASPFDHLARFGEWDTTQEAASEDLT